MDDLLQALAEYLKVVRATHGDDIDLNIIRTPLNGDDHVRVIVTGKKHETVANYFNQMGIAGVQIKKYTSLRLSIGDLTYSEVTWPAHSK
jgi:hypothetical protein